MTQELTIHDGKDPLFIGLLTLVAILFGIVFRVLEKKIPLYVVTKSHHHHP